MPLSAFPLYSEYGTGWKFRRGYHPAPGMGQGLRYSSSSGMRNRKPSSTWQRSSRWDPRRGELRLEQEVFCWLKGLFKQPRMDQHGDILGISWGYHDIIWKLWGSPGSPLGSPIWDYFGISTWAIYGTITIVGEQSLTVEVSEASMTAVNTKAVEFLLKEITCVPWWPEVILSYFVLWAAFFWYILGFSTSFLG
jgi:hypothetical protein